MWVHKLINTNIFVQKIVLLFTFILYTVPIKNIYILVGYFWEFPLYSVWVLNYTAAVGISALYQLYQ